MTTIPEIAAMVAKIADNETGAIDDSLDAALAQTFPASDPPSVVIRGYRRTSIKSGFSTTLAAAHEPEGQFTMYTSRIDLSDHVRKTACALLQARLTDALDLEAQLKQAHWNVKGRDFLQLHELFDDIHGRVEEFVDLIAERITALGGVADGRVQTTAKASNLYEYALETHAGEGHLRAVAAALAQFGKLVRGDIETAAAAGDADTADVFTEISRNTDKQLWLVEAHLS